MMRVLVPARLRKAVRTWFDSRYISIADHRQDIRDALWEVQTLRREMATLQSEVERLRTARPPVADKAKIDEARRLAQETAKALDGVLQNEVLVWQAIDDLRARQDAAETAAAPASGGATGTPVFSGPAGPSGAGRGAVARLSSDEGLVRREGQ
ncbi:hypothetical protein [Nonomuraea jiangxiensis]|uniref:Uncharacterized protein n=1 Tax=Nonomuraea jiangxiensis TaxID=633440 RepID=A0A1G8Z9Y7_9ACTN|nr:hypothetical protein [Nonomuraea jiangxiensis]SDK11882.1 hypothetical protein SAMN05421869_1143 [Nonomuraea jiangxiensis]